MTLTGSGAPPCPASSALVQVPYQKLARQPGCEETRNDSEEQSRRDPSPGAHVAPSVPVWGPQLSPRLMKETPLSALREIFSDLKACNGQDFAGHGESRSGCVAESHSRWPLPIPGTAATRRCPHRGWSPKGSRGVEPLLNRGYTLGTPGTLIPEQLCLSLNIQGDKPLKGIPVQHVMGCPQCPPWTAPPQGQKKKWTSCSLLF